MQLPWTAEFERTLSALIDCIIPADDFPSASENGVVEYLHRLLRSDLQQRADEVRLGLAALNEEAQHRHNKPFADLAQTFQIDLLRSIENGDDMWAVWIMPPQRFFELMITLTNEGYYTDPGNGSNVDGASWKMIGYDPRIPGNPPEQWLEGLP
jgi:hypothetical protein